MTEIEDEPEIETVKGPSITPWVTDAEMIRRLGVPDKIARAALHALDRDKASGFPQKKALWGNRRYWPAVVAYFDHHYGYGTHKPRSAVHGPA